MKVEIELRDEMLDAFVVGQLRDSLEMAETDIKSLKAKKFLKEYEEEDLKYSRRLAKALRLVIRYYS